MNRNADYFRLISYWKILGLDKVFGSGILFIVLWVRSGHLKDALQKPGHRPASARMH